MHPLKNAAPLALAFACVTAFVEGTARADDARCLAAFDSTQLLRKEGKLRAAREQALQCSLVECPHVVARECATWVSQLDAALPTAAFAAKSTRGGDLVDVDVVIDGATVAKRLDGRAIALDPGPHRLRMSASGHEPKELDVLVVEGEKNRKISVELTALAAKPPRDEPRPTPASSSSVPTLTWILGGVAIAAGAGSAIFAIDGFAKKGELDDARCKPGCADDDVSAMTRSLAIADVLGIVAVVSAGAAIVLYLTRDPSSTRTSSLPLGVRF